MKNYKAEKIFGFLFSVIFFGLFFYFYSKAIFSYLFFLISIFLFFITIFKPQHLVILNKKWISFGMILGDLLSPIILFFVYLLVLVPTGILIKILNFKISKKKKK